jgi:hypothetical protein
MKHEDFSPTNQLLLKLMSTKEEQDIVPLFSTFFLLMIEQLTQDELQFIASNEDKRDYEPFFFDVVKSRLEEMKSNG